MTKLEEKISGFIKNRSEDGFLIVKQSNMEGENVDFFLLYGKTKIYIECAIINDKTKDELVSLISVVKRNCRVDGTLMSKLLELNGQLLYGAFGIVEDIVFYRYSVLGGQHIDEDVFFNALYAVTQESQDFDAKIGIDFIEDEVKKEDGNDL